MPKLPFPFKMKTLLVALSLAATAAGVPCLHARAQARTASEKRNSLDVGGAFTYLHSNAPSGECGCFSGSGGTASVQFTPREPALGFVADVTLVHASNLLGSTENMTLLTYTFGPRYHFSSRRLGRAKPFLEALFGGAHTSSNYTFADGANGVAGVAGGGLDISVNRRFSIRAGEVDYVYTAVRNGVNNQQDSLRVSAGFTVRLR